MELSNKFSRLKRSVGGNREKTGFEFTFGLPPEEAAFITPPHRAVVRILGELDFAIRLSAECEHKYDEAVDRALDYLLDCMENTGAITIQQTQKAEELLAPLGKAAKEYKLILAAHAHIDMNWQWGYHETVAATLATFRTILAIMEEYPEFHFSQSQASVYKIVEEQDPELMERIKARIAEGRWECTATGWVETDKNMPNTESLLRHIQYTREYLSTHWGVKDFDIDFSPDTFGHNANIPEIDNFGEVKYLYHCRALDGPYALYRFQAPSGKEILAYREPYWYNSGVTPHIGAGIFEISRRCAGLKTGLIVYGVGDHGGGPTRRDVERALDMMTWPIFPELRFGTIRQFFREAEAVRDKLPVIDHELNYFANGCYTTQSRIKRGNRRLESALCDAESAAVRAGSLAGMTFSAPAFRRAWQSVLFSHFHDIITGSCVQESREYALGQYQSAMATANTQYSNALRIVAEAIDTSGISADPDAYNTQSEGAGVGYGIESFTGVPSPERGSGLTRIFHVFNPLAFRRREVAELTVWDWTGDLRNIVMKDASGAPAAFQLVDKTRQKYWDHLYFRILAEVDVPALGYTTLVLSDGGFAEYPFYHLEDVRSSPVFPDFTLENEEVRAVIRSCDGRLSSLFDKKTGCELIRPGETAGLVCIETEAATSSAWDIGRYLSEEPVTRCVNIAQTAAGPLRTAVTVSYTVKNSAVDVTYSLDLHRRGIRADIRADWHETGGDTVPVLVYRAPTAFEAQEYLYDIPAGSLCRGEMHNDVPGLQYGAALNPAGASLLLASDCKYGYRAAGGSLAVTLLNSATDPDPYPERGIHPISLLIGAFDGSPRQAEDEACRFTHGLAYASGNAHRGTLPMEAEFLSVTAETSVISAVTGCEDGSVAVRLYETAGKTDAVTLRFGREVLSACSVNLLEQPDGKEIKVNGRELSFIIEPRSLFEVKVTLN